MQLPPNFKFAEIWVYLGDFWQKKTKDLSQFQRKSAHAPQKELPNRKL